MTTAFWISAALPVLVALVFVAWPLLRQPRAGAVATQTALLREQLDALKSAFAADLIDEATFKSRQQALSAAALALVEAPASAKPGISRAAKLTTLVVLLVIPVATLQLYQKIGTPNAIGFSGPGAGTVETSAGPAMDGNSAPDLNKAADTLAAKLKDTPDDGAGWALLARTYRATERFIEANDAYTKARALLPEDPDLLAESAEAMGLSATPRSLSGEPEKLIARALELDPNNQNALFLKGLARAQADDPAGAEATWEQLLGLMEAGSPAQIAVVEQLNIVRERLGKAPMETQAAAPAAPMAAPASAPMAAGNKAPDPNAAGIDVSVRVAPELADLVQPGDTLFVFARAEAGPPAPLAIQRRTAGELPITLRLDESMGMIAGMSMAQFPRVIIGARISRSGNAMPQAGDLEGLTAAMSWREAGKVEIVIGSVR
ncbi:MAG TPA: c-type cytochrome biogenesis protein CcmI [Xanthomonadales bacterium]|nr:c-type cytochrome biogenesis protein CcmI [Xanthomonadales bacterium]